VSNDDDDMWALADMSSAQAVDRSMANGVGEDHVHCEPHEDEEEQPGMECAATSSPVATRNE